jgi:hypothetical protein
MPKKEERKGMRKQTESGITYRVSRMTASVVLAVGISVGTVSAADNAVEKSPVAGATTQALKPPALTTTVTQTGPVVAAKATEMTRLGMGCLDAPFAHFGAGDQTNRVWFHTWDWGKRNQRFIGTPDRPCGTLVWNKSREQLFKNSSSIDGKVWIMSLYSCGDGILAFLHVEFAAPGNKGRVALAWSTDGANTFTWLGNIVAPYLDKDLTGGFIIGVPYLVVGSYFYIYENDNNGIACARALVSDVIAAAKNGTVTTWKKYYNGEWNQDGLGGNSSVLPGLDNWGITHVQAIHSTTTGKYYMPLTRMTWGTDSWIKLYESDDAINWSLLSTLTNQPASEVGANNGWQYATLVSTDANATNATCESSFYLYCGYHPYDGDKTLYRWTFVFDKKSVLGAAGDRAIPASGTNVGPGEQRPKGSE